MKTTNHVFYFHPIWTQYKTCTILTVNCMELKNLYNNKDSLSTQCIAVIVGADCIHVFAMQFSHTCKWSYKIITSLNSSTGTQSCTMTIRLSCFSIVVVCFLHTCVSSMCPNGSIIFVLSNFSLLLLTLFSGSFLPKCYNCYSLSYNINFNILWSILLF